MSKVKVELEFTNKKGVNKKVTFPMDKKYYEDLQNPEITEDMRKETMLYEYRKYCKDRKYARRHQSFKLDDDGNYIEPADENQTCLEAMIEKQEADEKHEKLMNLLYKLTKKQCQAMILVHIVGLKQEEAAKELGISQPAMSKLLKNAMKNLERIVGRKIFLK